MPCTASQLTTFLTLLALIPYATGQTNKLVLSEGDEIKLEMP